MHALLAAVLRASILGACVLVIPFVSLQDVWADKGADKVIVTNTAANPVPVVIQGSAGSQRESVEIVTQTSNGNITNTIINVYTVPAGKRLTITDVIITYEAADNAPASIYRNGATVSKISQHFSSYEHSYVSGIVFTESQTVSVSTAAGGLTNWELRGFLE